MIRAQPSFEPSSAERAGSPARTPVEVAGWLLLAGLVLYLCVFSGLTTLGFVGPDEPRYASIARAMAASQDWVTPRLYGEPWLEKPILYYWAAGLAYRLGGETEWAARLPSALSAGLTSLAVAWLGWRLFGALTGAIAFVVFPTTVATFALARGATTDMLFSASLTVAMVAAAPRLLTNDRRRRWAAMFGVAVGFATLAKGPAGILLAVGSVMLWGVASGQTARLRALVCLLNPPDARICRGVSHRSQPRPLPDSRLSAPAAVLVFWPDSGLGYRSVVGVSGRDCATRISLVAGRTMEGLASAIRRSLGRISVRLL